MVLQLTKNQRADVMKLIAGEQARLSKVAGEGTTFEEGFAAGRVSLLMDLLVGTKSSTAEETVPPSSSEQPQQTGRRRNGNGGAMSSSPSTIGNGGSGSSDE
jgi:hypothetical protein